jgi:hypothetical protein
VVLAPVYEPISEKRHYLNLSERLAYGSFLETEARSELKIVHRKVTYQLNASTEIPYDYYCPSINAETISSRTCPDCQIYFPSVAALNRHSPTHRASDKSHENDDVIEESGEENTVENSLENSDESPIPVLEATWENPWTGIGDRNIFDMFS